MERIPLPKSIPQDTQNILNQILDGAVGDVIQLSADVTTSGGQLKTNQVGFNPTSRKLFFNFFGSIYSVTLTLT